jgi:hypothetical protein
LPVPVLGRPAQRGLDARVVEPGQRDGGTPPDGRLVVEGGQHGRQACRVADGAQRGHGRLTAAWVGMRGGHAGQRDHGGPVAPLGEVPGRADHDERVGIAQRAHHGGRQGRARARAAHGHRGVHGAPAHLDGAVVTEDMDHVVAVQGAEARQRAHGGGPHPRVGVGEPASGQLGIAAVTGGGDTASPQLDAAVADGAARIRGRIVAHRPEYVRPRRALRGGRRERSP